LPVSGGAFAQSCNAPAGVDTETMRVVTAHVSQACNDKREVQPAIGAVQAPPELLGQVQSRIADEAEFLSAGPVLRLLLDAEPG
jgi:hypothetical protein